jgi:hypothetical protein
VAGLLGRFAGKRVWFVLVCLLLYIAYISAGKQHVSRVEGREGGDTRYGKACSVTLREGHVVDDAQSSAGGR